MREWGGRVCAITGAGSGIGRALALELASRGSRLAVSDVNGDAARATASLCAGRGAEAEAFVVDVSIRDAVEAYAEDVVSRFGTVNLAVNNAGVAMHQHVADTPIEDLEWIMGINFWGVVYGTKAFLPHLIASGDGYLVNISSVFGLIALPGQAGYNATKFAVRGFTEALRQEMLTDRHPVGVSCVHPGGIRTAIARSAKIGTGDSAELVERFDKVARTSPEAAARTIIRGVERRRARILIGPDARALDVMQRTFASGYQRIVYRATRRYES